MRYLLVILLFSCTPEPDFIRSGNHHRANPGEIKELIVNDTIDTSNYDEWIKYVTEREY